MISNIKFFLLCPIPEEQKPITNYLQLKENKYTNIITFSESRYQKVIFSYFLLIFLFLSYIELFSNSFDFSILSLNWFSKTILITLGILFLYFFTIFYLWKENFRCFQNTRIFYEEASWYDGQIWDKPMLIIKNDRLLNNQKIKPILQRLKNLLVFLSLLMLVCLFIIEIL